MLRAKIRIGEIRKALAEFGQKQKEGRKFAQKNYLRKREGPNKLSAT